MRCDTCIFWKANLDHQAEQVGFKECTGVRTRWVIEDEATAGIERYPKDEPLVEFDYDDVGKRWAEAHLAGFRKEKAYTQDGSQYKAELFTAADFFCAKYTPIVKEDVTPTPQ